MIQTRTDTRASGEWARRPDDQRYLTVPALLDAVRSRRQQCTAVDVALDCTRVEATDDNRVVLTDPEHDPRRTGLVNNWAFSQLCQRAKAPAGYLRSLPAPLAAINLQWSLEKREAASDEGNDAKLLLRHGDAGTLATVSAVTSATYGRIWDADVVSAVMDRVDLTKWVVPAASYSARDPKRATTLYASDRDVFMFLVNEGNPIEAKGEALNRGIYVWNSEVGSSIFGFAAFTYDYICDNRMVWGQANFKEIKIRHTSGGPHRFLAQAAPALTSYVNAGTADMVATITRAKAKEVGNDRESVQSWLLARGFGKTLATKAYESARDDVRGYNPRSVWGLVQGLTDAAHDIPHTDERIAVERKAGNILEVFAAA